jgi:hypothetical protein
MGRFTKHILYSIGNELEGIDRSARQKAGFASGIAYGVI